MPQSLLCGCLPAAGFEPRQHSDGSWPVRCAQIYFAELGLLSLLEFPPSACFYEPQLNYWTLIDRQADPHDVKNVYNEESYAQTMRDLHAELDRLRKELKVPAEDAPASRSAVRLRVGAGQPTLGQNK